MDKIWYRNPSKSEVIGRCGEDEINEWPRRTDKSRKIRLFFFSYLSFSLQTKGLHLKLHQEKETRLHSFVFTSTKPKQNVSGSSMCMELLSVRLIKVILVFRFQKHSILNRLLFDFLWRLLWWYLIPIKWQFYVWISCDKLNHVIVSIVCEGFDIQLLLW